MKRLLWMMALALPLAAQAPYARIQKADSEPGNWLTYSGNYSSHRFSRLNQITTANVKRLKPAWVYQTRARDKFETTPLVIDGVMYLTEPPSNVTALDTRTGRSLWTYRRTYPKDLRLCCGQVNRGVAALDDLVFVGTVDAHLIALDRATGLLRWDTTVADYKTGHSITVAPLAVKDKVVVGIAGGEFGVRGFVDAYDAKTGTRAWRFWTVPAKGEPGNETWEGDSWKTGSATSWVTGSYDPEMNVVFWGTGNPGPDWNGDVRGGANLYSDCLVALDVDTGQLRWYYQFTPHDVHDWDATEIPVLAEAVVRGEKRKVVLFANRNGFYYVLDRKTGQYLVGKQMIRQTWAKGLDDSGKPIRLPNTFPSVEGTKVYPSIPGATNWFSPSYSPLTSLYYVALREEGAIYYQGEAEYKPGSFFNAGGARTIPGEEPWGAIRAFKPATGEKVWEFKLFSPPWAGVLSTAGGLVFGGTEEGAVFALDAATGKSLWQFQTGGEVASNPISYLSGGKQYIAIAAGNGIFAFALEE
ncbi:MAG: PQQ-dependent dehydrogenase, methanol/ethanol family [Acidobacteria bacterium]|nr:PQQ-dependent dehydrogenase, methanol/ethanol family [Acidobacteriota bacterium]